MAKKRTASPSTRSLEKAARKAGRERYVLRLYVAGMSPVSQQAVRNITAICEEHLTGAVRPRGRRSLPAARTLAAGEQIIAAPR